MRFKFDENLPSDSGALLPLLTLAAPSRRVPCMSLAQLKDQASHLQTVEQRELIAFLISLQTEKDEDFKRALARKIDDTEPSHWVNLDELQKRYSEQPSA
jgi:hypothetical protein